MSDMTKYFTNKILFLVLLLITGLFVFAYIHNFLYKGTVNNRPLNSRFKIKVQTTLNDFRCEIINALSGKSTDGEGRNRGIPKIIHQIWNDEFIPAVFQENIKGLTAHNKHPEWKYYFWTPVTGHKFIKDKFPNLVQRYSAADNLLKADILRLAALYHYGGVYFDLDTVSVKPLDAYVESHDCSLVTDPPEHVFNPNNSEPVLMITNSAMLCKPSNWFILHIIKQLEGQPETCNDAISCTGPRFISKHYKDIRGTNRSADLPIIDDYRLFEDMVDVSVHPRLAKECVEPFTSIKYEWSREICRNWIARGKAKRNISEKAYTYHTWFHTYYDINRYKLERGFMKNIKEIVKHAKFYKC